MPNQKRDAEGKYTFSAGKGKTLIPTSSDAHDTPLPVGAVADVDAIDEVYSKYVKYMTTEDTRKTGTDWEKIDDMETFGINPEELPENITSEQVDDALDMIREARGNYQFNRNRPGSRDYDPSDTEGLAQDAFESLGYESAEAYRKASACFKDVEWEGQYYFGMDDEDWPEI